MKQNIRIHFSQIETNLIISVKLEFVEGGDCKNEYTISPSK